MRYCLVGEGSRERILVQAESAMGAARKCAAEHPGTEDIFVQFDLDDPPPNRATWQRCDVFPRNTL
jgi:hypothetical protein